MPRMLATLKVRQFRGANWVGTASLMRRQMKSGLADINYTILGPVISNALYLLVFATAAATLTTLDPKAVLAFVAPGLICFTISERAYEVSGSNLINDKHYHVHFDWVMAPLSPLELTLCFAATATACGAIVGIAVAFMTLYFAFPGMPHPWAILVFGLGAGMFHGLVGTLLGLWAEKWDQYSALHTFVLLPLAFLSGVFNRVSELPQLAQTLIHLNPIFYMIDGFRYGMTGEAMVDPGRSLFVLAASNLALALWTYRWFASGKHFKA